MRVLVRLRVREACAMAGSAVPSTMKAWQYSSFQGGAEALKLAEAAPVPSPKAGQVLVKVSVAAMNLLDCKLQHGDLRPFMPPSLPFTPGYDVAGEVVAVGPKVTGFQVGDQIYGGTSMGEAGTFAEYVAVPAAAAAKIPSGLSPGQAAALVTQGCAALQALRDSGGLQISAEGGAAPSPPPNVCVANATGGVGIVAVQLAKLAGAHVTATCGQRNIEFVKSLGADEVLDYKTPEGQALKSPSGAKYDVLLDGTPNASWKIVKPVLAPAGKWLNLSPSPAVALASLWPILTLSRQRLVMITSAAKAADLETLAGLAAGGRLAVHLDSETPFSRLPEAWAKCAKATGILGKLLVTMD